MKYLLRSESVHLMGEFLSERDLLHFSASFLFLSIHVFKSLIKIECFVMGLPMIRMTLLGPLIKKRNHTIDKRAIAYCQ